MDSEKICKICYPEEFKTNKIKEHYKVREDLEKLLEKTGYKDKFKRLYRQRLRHLNDRGVDCIKKTDWFESLKNSPGMYSMKFKGQKNIRILFTFTSMDSNEINILLVAFEEKVTKDYNKAIATAYDRLDEITD